MKTVFADTQYWVAIASPQDQLHGEARRAGEALGPCRILTTEEVLAELLTFFCRMGPTWRQKAVRLVRHIQASAHIEVMPQSHGSFEGGVGLYAQRPDKEYSLIDCISMATMRRRGIREVLTHDRHFSQEGFAALIGPER